MQLATPAERHPFGRDLQHADHRGLIPLALRGVRYRPIGAAAPAAAESGGVRRRRSDRTCLSALSSLTCSWCCCTWCKEDPQCSSKLNSAAALRRVQAF